MTLESGAQASAEGITISGKRTEGASKPQVEMACSIQCWFAWEFSNGRATAIEERLCVGFAEYVFI
jgi:hypothetical protein